MLVLPVMLSPRGQAGLEANIVLGLGLEELSSASSICPRTSFVGLVKMSVVMELVITVSLQ